MDIRITPARLAGVVTPPPSKSLSHRALIAAYLAGAPERVRNPAQSQDITATRRCMEALLTCRHPDLDCGESGSTLRFLIPLSLVLRGGGRFLGHGRLMERPLGPYLEIFKERKIYFERHGCSAELEGELTSGVYELPGDISSQFVTGLLYALPLLDGDSEIRLTTPLESREYVTMTLDVLRRFGIKVENHGYSRFIVSGRQKYVPVDYTVEADWSQAGFWYAAGSCGCDVTVSGLDPDSPQGDKAVAELCERLKTSGDLGVDVSQIPDLLPPLAVMAAVRDGETRFLNAARLRIKESDRIATTAAMLRSFGAQCREGQDFLTVRGGGDIRSCVVDGANDHRIVMAAAILALRADGEVTIRGAEAVNKSYPRFFDDYTRLGGVFDVL